MLADRRRVFFALFALSGFSGLIYESIWTHYLKLFLGHAAYAQTLVLAIFMGGMACGSWLSSRRSARCPNLLRAYAVAEVAVGLCALVFHPLFEGAVSFSFDHVIPALGGAAAVTAFKWCLGSLLILPQSVLLGMTFPLMSGGIVRRFPGTEGSSIALLYFSNSVGAAFGVLASGFFLISFVGLPGTMRLAGVVNLLLALVVWRLCREPEALPAAQQEREEGDAATPAPYRFMLAASLVTGAASFLYEIGWIRMLTLVLGASTHAFELMLSAFILGLALGGFAIRRRIDATVNAIPLLALVQICMGLLALFTLVAYGNSFGLMRLLLSTVQRDATGYLLFNLSSHAIALAVMLPATFCAGMTLPLITSILLKGGHGERSIGGVYAANTVGAIIGVFAAVHLAIPLFGIKGVVVCGAALDLGLGILLLRRSGCAAPALMRRWAPAAAVCALLCTILFVRPDPYQMASGVYRDGDLMSPHDTTLLFHRDGKTSTVSVSSQGGKTSIRTNGKVDGAIVMEPGVPANYDETTMILTGAIPMALHPGARTVANIGLGTGLTTHTLLGNPRLERVDTIEIEEAMVEGARFFGHRNERVYKDRRSHIHIDDAKTFFSTHKLSYDLIVSEPSNPWVSGVSGLFSGEFYRLASKHLNEGGLLVQWMQMYEIEPSLVASVLKAVSASFTDFVVYAPDDGDLLIIAKKGGKVGEVAQSVLQIPAVREALERINVRGPRDIEVRRIGEKALFEGLLAGFDIPANSDYYPVLDQKAARARFLQASGQQIVSFIYDPLPVREMISGRENPWPETEVTPTRQLPKSVFTHRAMALRDFFRTGSFDPRYTDLPEDLVQEGMQVRRMIREGDPCGGEGERLALLFNLALKITPYLHPAELDQLWQTLDPSRCGVFTERERRWLTLYRAVGTRDGVGMSRIARSILGSGEEIPDPMRKYAVAAAMLGALARGDKAEALQVWSAQADVMYGGSSPDPLFRLLRGAATR